MLKRILLISIHGDPLAKLGSTQSGGQNNYVKQLMNSLNKKGYQIDTITHWRDPLDSPLEVINPNLRVIRIAAKQLKFVPKDEMYHLLNTFYNEVKAKVDLNSYDVVHTNYWLSGTLGYLIKQEFNLPWVHISHSLGLVKAASTGTTDELRIHCEEKIFEAADSIITTTYNEKETLLNKYHTKTNIEVIPVGVDDTFFLSPNTRPPRERYYLFIGRLEETKGIDVLIEAFKLIQNKTSEKTRLMIVGGGCKETNEFAIPDHVKDNIKGTEERITFTGSLSQDELVSLFAGALTTIVPSHYESFGMVASESQAVGVPVLATRVGGLQEVVQDGKTGYLFENKNSRELAKLMLKLSENDYLRKKLGKQGREHALANFDWDNITDEVIMLYKELVESDAEYLSPSN